jgi:hypothetical protein
MCPLLLGRIRYIAYFISGMTYDPINDIIYTVGKGDYLGPGIGWHLDLGIIDPQGLTITIVGETGINNVSGGLAYVSSVPAPPAFWLFGTGLLGPAGMARCKKAA